MTVVVDIIIWLHIVSNPSPDIYKGSARYLQDIGKKWGITRQEVEQSSGAVNLLIGAKNKKFDFLEAEQSRIYVFK